MSDDADKKLSVADGQSTIRGMLVGCEKGRGFSVLGGFSTRQEWDLRPNVILAGGLDSIFYGGSLHLCISAGLDTRTGNPRPFSQPRCL